MKVRQQSLHVSPARLEATAFRDQQPSIPALQALTAQRQALETLKSISLLLVADFLPQALVLFRCLLLQMQMRTRSLQLLALLVCALLGLLGPIPALLGTIHRIRLVLSSPSTNARFVMSTEYARLWLTVSLLAPRVSLVPTTIAKRATSAQSRRRAGSRSLVPREAGMPRPQVPR